MAVVFLQAPAVRLASRGVFGVTWLVEGADI